MYPQPLDSVFVFNVPFSFQVKSGTIFDNILITDSEEYAEEVGNETWGATKDPEKKMKDKVCNV